MTGTTKSNKDTLKGLKGLLPGNKEQKSAEKTTKPTVKPVVKSTTESKVSGTVKPGASQKLKKTTTIKHVDAGSTTPKIDVEKIKAEKAEQSAKQQEEVLHSKTHQDLINAAYKAAEKLGIAPWVLLRAAGWGNFTEDRGKKYTGPIIDELEGLDVAQKAALKEILGL